MIRVTAILAVLLAAAGPASAVTGEAVAVVQRAVIASDGTTVTLNEGRPVALGDTIATGEGGEAQLLFPDDTRIVVGPNSQLAITRLLFRDNGTAQRFTVSAVRGTFRFLSGDSPSRAYRIRTPTATMGVRGTSFDFAVADQEETDLVVYEGLVNFCAGGRCARVPGGCQAVRINRQGNFSQPETVGERSEKLDARFPYATQQQRLQARFRTSTAACDDDDDSNAVVRVNAPVRQIALPAAARATGGGGGDGGRRGNPAE